MDDNTNEANELQKSNIDMALEEETGKPADNHSGDLPILEFHCHKTQREKARKIITMLANSTDTQEAHDSIVDTPLIPTAGIIKNHLVGITHHNIAVFAINLKTGLPENPETARIYFK